MDKTKRIHKTTRKRRAAAWLLSAVLAFSALGSGMTAFASGLDTQTQTDAYQETVPDDTGPSDAVSNVVMTTVGTGDTDGGAAPDGSQVPPTSDVQPDDGTTDGIVQPDMPQGDGTNTVPEETSGAGSTPADAPDADDTGADAPITTGPVELTVSMSATPAVVKQGEEVKYEVKITGKGDASYDLSIQLPDGVTAPQDLNLDTTEYGGGTVVVNGGSIKMTGCKYEVAGSTDTISFPAKVAADAAVGTDKKANVTLTGTDITGTLTADAAIEIAEADNTWTTGGDLEITLTHGTSTKNLSANPLTVYPGERVYYRITVQNKSGAELEVKGLQIQLPAFLESITASSNGVPLPSNVVEYSWTMKGATAYLDVSGVVSQGSAGLEGKSQASVGDIKTNIVTDTVGAQSGAVRSEITVTGGTKDKTNPSIIMVNPEEVLNISIVVKNEGKGTARMAQVSMNWLSGCSVIKSDPMMMGASTGLATWSLGDIPSGQTASISVQASMPSDGLTGTWFLSPLVSWTDDMGEQSAYAVNVYQIKPSGAQAGSVSVTMTQNGTTGTIFVDKDDTVTYSAVIKNEGSQPLSNVKFECSLPEGLSLASTGNGQSSGAMVDGVYVLDVGTINAGATKTVSFTVEADRVRKAATRYVTANVTSDRASASSNTLTVRFGKADVWAELKQQANISGMTAEDMYVQPGDEITYQVTVYNDGLSDADDVILYDTLPSGVTADVSGSKWYKHGQDIEYDMGTVKAGKSRTVQFTVKVSQSANTGTKYLNMVTLDYSDMPDDVDEIETNELTAIVGDIHMNTPGNSGNGTVPAPGMTGNLSVIALSSQTNSHMLLYGESDTIVVNISYTGLTPQAEYTANVELRNKDTGELLSLNGKSATGTQNFKPAAADGTLTTSMSVSPMQMRGQGVVANVTIVNSVGNIIAQADGLTDEARMVRAGMISGNLTASDRSSKNVPAGNNIQVVNTVTFTNLAPGQEYRLVAELFDRNTGEPIRTGGTAVVTTKEVPVEKNDSWSNTQTSQGGTSSTSWSGSQGAPSNLTGGSGSGAANGNGAAGNGTAGNGAAGNGTAGNGASGNGAAGTGESGNGQAQPSSGNTQVQTKTVTETTYDMSSAKPVTASTTFRPVESNGATEVIFVLNTIESSGSQYVVKTRLYDMRDNLIAEDADTNTAVASAKGATVRTQARVQTGVEDWGLPVAVGGFVLLMGCGGAAAFLYYRKRELFNHILRR